jgi:cyanate permease
MEFKDFKMQPTTWLGGLVIVTFGLAVYWVMEGSTLPTDAARLTFLGSVVGYLAAMAQQVVGYYFGSSSGSKDSRDAVIAIAKGETGPPGGSQ